MACYQCCRKILCFRSTPAWTMRSRGCSMSPSTRGLCRAVRSTPFVASIRITSVFAEIVEDPRLRVSTAIFTISWITAESSRLHLLSSRSVRECICGIAEDPRLRDSTAIFTILWITPSESSRPPHLHLLSSRSVRVCICGIVEDLRLRIYGTAPRYLRFCGLRLSKVCILRSHPFCHLDLFASVFVGSSRILQLTIAIMILWINAVRKFLIVAIIRGS